MRPLVSVPRTPSQTDAVIFHQLDQREVYFMTGISWRDLERRCYEVAGKKGKRYFTEEAAAKAGVFSNKPADMYERVDGQEQPGRPATGWRALLPTIPNPGPSSSPRKVNPNAVVEFARKGAPGALRRIKESVARGAKLRRPGI